MKIFYINDYLPQQSQSAKHIYLLAPALGRLGQEIHIITGALDLNINSGRPIDFSDKNELFNYQPKNVFVHSLNESKKYGGDYENSRLFFEKLLTLGLRNFELYKGDIIEANFMAPYCLVGWIIKIVYHRPLILRLSEEMTKLPEYLAGMSVYWQVINSAELIMGKENSLKALKSQVEPGKLKLLPELNLPDSTKPTEQEEFTAGVNNYLKIYKDIINKNRLINGIYKILNNSK